MNTPLHKNVAVVLTFEKGTFESGFSVVAKILENGVRIEQRDRILLPPVPDLKSRYETWKQQYIEQATRMIEIPAAQVHHANVEACREAAKELLTYLREQWFDSDRFQLLKEWIKSRALVQADRSVPIFFEFDTHSREQDTLFRRLPWSCWDLFGEVPHAEATLGIAYTNPVNSSLRNLKILAVFGSDEGGLNLDKDRNFVSKLKKFGARVHDLSCPQPDRLYSTLKDNTYDIFFFAGHSLSQTDQRSGEILLQPQKPLSLEALLPCLQAAVGKGLKLAIFNSCDGLGLADFLVTKAKIPSVIVFREPVPDVVARKFLQYFIEEFSRETPLFLSVREARNRLQALETSLPCASWLPVICQNPSQSELIWKQTSWRDRLGKTGTILLAFVSLMAVTWLWKNLIEKRPKPQSQINLSDSLIGQSESASESIVISRGDKLVITSKKNKAKTQGIEAYHQKKWQEAIDAFRASLHQEWEENNASNLKESLDPETWIYLNNAIAEKKAKFNVGQLVQLAIAVPARDKKAEQLLAKEFLQGAALRQTEFNCGVENVLAAIEDIDIPLSCTFDDRKQFIHVTIANDRDDEEVAKKVAIELSNLSIVGTIGHFSSDSCLQSIQVYESQQIPMISPTCTSTNLSDFSEYFFRTIPNDADAAKNLWARVGDNQTKMAIAYSRNSEFTESFKNAFSEQLPTREYIYICDDLADNFYAPGCAEEAKAKGANFLLLVPTTTETINAALSILPHLDREIVPIGSDSVYNQAIIDPDGYGREAAETGLQLYVSWHPSSNPNNQTDFEKNATRMFGVEEWNWHSQSSYDAMSALAQGVRELEGDLEGRKLMKKLHSSGFAADGVVGEKSVKFLASGDRDITGFEHKIGTIVRVVEDRDEHGEIGYRFVDVDE